MVDPERLLDDPTTAGLGHRLLEAAGDDAPSAAGRARTAKRLGIAAGFGSTAAAGGSAVATIFAISALFGGLGVVAVAVTRTPAQPPVELPVVERAVAPIPGPTPDPAPGGLPVELAPAPGPAVAAKSPPHAPRVPIAAIEPPPAGEAPPIAPAPGVEAPPVEPPAPVEVRPTEAPPAVAPPPAAPPPVPVDARRLAAEVAQLDHARELLRRGDPAAALAALDTHDREFADGVLVAETTLVRIEALAKGGQPRAARDLATGLLARFPRSPLVPRVRALLVSLP